MTSTTSPLLQHPGAVSPPDDSPDVGVAWHYGDPLAEQRAAERGVGIVDRSHRDVIAIPGEERLTWLHTITSQHVSELDEGSSTETLVLDAHGRVEHHATVSHVDSCLWLDTEPGRGAGLLSYLESMRFWSKVEPRDASSELAVLSLIGPDVLPLLASFRPPEGGFTRQVPGGAEVVVPRDELGEVWRRLVDSGAHPAGSWAYEALRAAALRPRLGVDTDERTIPHEAGWIGQAVHLDKGCYRGQETVSRVANLGKPPRRMVLLHLDGSDNLPSSGDALTADGRTVGRVGTVVTHHELGPIALALVKRSVRPETALVAGEGTAASIDPDSVPPDSGEPPGKAALRRLRG